MLGIRPSSSGPWLSLEGDESSTDLPQVYFYIEFAMHSSTVPGSASGYLVGGVTESLFYIDEIVGTIVKV